MYLILFCIAGFLEPMKRPTKVFFVDSIPKNGLGKIVRKKIKLDILPKVMNQKNANDAATDI